MFYSLDTYFLAIYVIITERKREDTLSRKEKRGAERREEKKEGNRF